VFAPIATAIARASRTRCAEVGVSTGSKGSGRRRTHPLVGRSSPRSSILVGAEPVNICKDREWKASVSVIGSDKERGEDTLGPTIRKFAFPSFNCRPLLLTKDVGFGRVPVPLTVVAAPVYFAAHAVAVVFRAELVVVREVEDVSFEVEVMVMEGLEDTEELATQEEPLCAKPVRHPTQGSQ
jgi:hypothetical protein